MGEIQRRERVWRISLFRCAPILLLLPWRSFSGLEAEFVVLQLR